MTAMFDLGTTEITDTERAQRMLDDAKADHALSVALDHATVLGGRAGLRLLSGYRNRIAAVESQILAEHVRDDGNTRAAERMVADGKTSKREQRKRANRAKAVSRNDDLAAQLAAGGLSEEQLDVIADASSKSDGDAACDTALIDKVAAVPPEQGKTIIDDYLADRATADGVQTEHDRQRRLRRTSKFHNKAKNLDSIGLEGDGVSNKAMWDAIERQADKIFRRDGGRDLPGDKHPRTRDQRRYDATFELITGQTTRPDGRTITTEAAGSDSTTASTTTATSRRHTPRTSQSARPQIVVGLTIDHALGLDPSAIACQVGLGLIPDTVVASYAANADIFAALFDRSGTPLWLGRLHRYATQTQMLALILRDRHCVLCGADHTTCQAHHTMPFNAPGKGRTDLDNLVLLCGPCHTQLHGDERTIYQDRNGSWRTRQATPDELPPPRPDETRNLVHRE